MAAPLLGNLTEHFSVGTFGAIGTHQVKISRKPWYTENSSIHVYLEVDDEAYIWLKEKYWMSALGLHLIRWQHVPVRGITGYVAPDEDVKTLKEKLLREQTQETNSATGSTEDQDRDRHVTGEDKKQEVQKNKVAEEVNPDKTLEKVPQELQEYHEELTEEQEAELLQQAEDSLNTTVVYAGPDTRTSTPTRQRSPATPRKNAKAARGTRSDGTPYSDPSESEDDRLDS